MKPGILNLIALALYAIFIAFSALDVITTIQAIESGKGKEANPIMKWLMDKLGMKPALILSKAALLILIAVALWKLDARISCVLLAFLNPGMAWVVWNNDKVGRAGVR